MSDARKNPTGEDFDKAVEEMDGQILELHRQMTHMKQAGFAVHVSTNHDTGFVYRFGGVPGWTCRVRSIKRSPKRGVSIRVSMLQLHDAVDFAYRRWRRELSGETP